MTTRIVLVFVLLLGTAAESQEPATTSSWSARVAGVRYALQNGWSFPQTKLVVAVEAQVGPLHGRLTPVSPTDRRREADDIAKLIGPSAIVGSAFDYLSCSPRTCYPTKNVPVLVVKGLLEGGDRVLVELYAPSVTPGEDATVTHGVVVLHQREGSWTAIRYSTSPTTTRAR